MDSPIPERHASRGLRALPAALYFLNPLLGHGTATKPAREALATGRGVVELIREQNLLTEEQISSVLDPAKMTGR